jgi:transposase
LNEIPADLRQTIEHITTDMWDGYLQAAADFIQKHDDTKAKIVVDRFHVAQNYRKGFDALRKKEFKRFKRDLSDDAYEQVCKGMHWVLRKNHSALEPEERARLRCLFEHSPLLHQAYTFREELTAIFNRPYSCSQAEQAIRSWYHKVWLSPVSCYDKFIKTLKRYWQYILNYFNRRVSSGFVEGLNNKIKTIKRRCYGINKVSSLFQRIWLDLQGRQLFFVSTP